MTDVALVAVGVVFIGTVLGIFFLALATREDEN